MNEIPVTYIRWDYDNGEAIEYQREGDCNGCGACCRAMIRFRVSGNCKDDDPRNLGDAKSAEINGVWAEVSKGDDRRIFAIVEVDHNPKEIPCSALHDNQCSVHFDKPHICAVWPVIPDQVALFKDCSYTFTEIQRWKFDPTPDKPAE